MLSYGRARLTRGAYIGEALVKVFPCLLIYAAYGPAPTHALYGYPREWCFARAGGGVEGIRRCAGGKALALVRRWARCLASRAAAAFLAHSTLAVTAHALVIALALPAVGPKFRRGPSDARNRGQRAPYEGSPINLSALPRETSPLASPLARSSNERSLASGDISYLPSRRSGMTSPA